MNLFRSAVKTLVIAHRGSSAHAPENTLASFRLAAEQGADAVELDAKLSSDKEVVVIHDQTVDRTTGASGRIGDLSLAQLKSLDAGSFFAPQFGGETLPTLAEVFEAVGRRVLINVELTNYASPSDDLVARVCALVKDFHLEERILFSSFHPGNLSLARRILPEVPCAILAMPGLKGWLARSFWLEGISPDAVNPYLRDVTAAYLRRQAQKSRKTNVWTVNEPAELTRLAREGASGLITDDPPAALLVLKSLNSENAPA
jgi:glycerophosphoryl diester phosphodiesterase